MIPEHIIDQVRAATDIVDLAREYMELKRTGSEFVASCPLPGHKDKSPSFKITPEKQICHCFPCDETLDVIALTQHFERCDFPEAVRHLGKRAGITIDQRPENPEQRQARQQQKSDKEKATWANRQAATLYTDQLWADPARVAYFTGRGFTEDTIRAWGLGWASDDRDQLRRHLATTAPGKEVGAAAAAETAALIRTHEESGRKYEFFRGRYMFPICDARGNVVAFTGRDPDPEAKAKKYFNTADASPVWEKGKTLFGLHLAEKAARTDRRLILVEGNVDAIAIHQMGFACAVAACGTSVTDNHLRMAKRYADTLTICLDNDAAGIKKTPQVVAQAIAAGLQTVQVIILQDIDDQTPIKDPGDLLALDNGAEIMGSLIDHAVDGWAYLLNHHTKDATTPAAIASAVATLKEIIHSHPDQIAQGLMVKDLSKASGVSIKEIKAKKPPRRKSSSRNETTVSQTLSNYKGEGIALRPDEICRQMLADQQDRLLTIGDSLKYIQKKNNLGSVVVNIGGTDALFAIIQNLYDVKWKDGGQDENGTNYVTRNVLFQALTIQAPAYRGISAFPFEPKPEDVFVRWTPPAGHEPDGSYLERFLDMFNPATAEDASLLEAFVIGTVWGGAPGARPLVVIAPQENGTQQAIGKSQLVIRAAQLVGGHMGLNLPKRGAFADGLSKQALEEINLPYRVALIDNVTGTIRDDSLTQLITAPKIAGRASYAKQAERSNVLTWAITTNEPNLSTDICSRTVLIRLAPCDREAWPNWDAEIQEFIRYHRDHVLADIIHRLRKPKKPLTKHTRFPAWDNAVLGCFHNPDGLVLHILKQQTEADRDQDEIAEFLAELAEEYDVHPPLEQDLKLHEIAEVWNRLHKGRELGDQQIAQIIRNAASRGRLVGKSGSPILEYVRRHKGRFWAFRPWDIEYGDSAERDTTVSPRNVTCVTESASDEF